MMELRLLRALEAVVDEGTFAAAAARLDYTQSTLSQQIAALESSVGGRVFDRPRGPRRVSLTPLGRLVLQHARDLNQRAESASLAIERFHGGDGRVDIGTFQTVTNVLLPPLVRRLREEHPDCDVRLFEDETPTPRLDDLDLVYFDAAPPPGVDGRLIIEDDHVLLAPPGRFPPGPVPLTALDNLPIVALPPICDQGMVEESLASQGISPQVIFRTADNQAVVSMVRAGLGCAILPALAIGPTPTPNPTNPTSGATPTSSTGPVAALSASSSSDPSPGSSSGPSPSSGSGSGSGSGFTLHPLTPGLPPRQIYLLWQGTLSPLASRFLALATQTAKPLKSPWVHPARPQKPKGPA
ncbi:LysR family transcriptional regulator [Kribbella sp. NPDC056861]|uniref:LysR family transcriptional regulator n=1 Tax=Kribbella sp. NPDC056861 TaxID=3154857 RepID=UPI00343C4733